MEIIVFGFPWSYFIDVQDADLWLIYQDWVKAVNPTFGQFLSQSISDNNYEYMLPFTNWGLK